MCQMMNQHWALIKNDEQLFEITNLPSDDTD